MNLLPALRFETQLNLVNYYGIIFHNIPNNVQGTISFSSKISTTTCLWRVNDMNTVPIYLFNSSHHTM